MGSSGEAMWPTNPRERSVEWTPLSQAAKSSRLDKRGIWVKVGKLRIEEEELRGKLLVNYYENKKKN